MNIVHFNNTDKGVFIMAQAIAETVFDIVYLGFALSAGLIMLIRGKTPLVKKRD